MTEIQKYNSYPQIPNWLGTSLVSISVIIMCYSYLIPVIPILVYFGMWLPLMLYKRTFFLKPSGAMLLTLTFPFLCFISFLWSDHVGRSIYSGVQFLVMATCIVIIARVVSYKSFLRGLAFGSMVVLFMSLIQAASYYGAAILDRPLSGFFGSKNQLGFVCVISILVSLTILFSEKGVRAKFLFGIAPIGIAAICLVLSQSATSVISILFALCVIFAAWIVSRLPRALKGVVVFLAFLLLATITTSIIAFEIDLFGGILEAFGKNSTLSGRTYLWQEGIKLGSESPILGVGYEAFWVPNNLHAERYWSEFSIKGQSGFNFHNMYIESFVVLGIFGVIAIAMVILQLLLRSFYYIIRDGLNIYTSLFFSFACLMAVRSLTEVEFIGPFGLQVFISLSILMRMSEYKQLMKNNTPD